MGTKLTNGREASVVNPDKGMQSTRESLLEIIKEVQGSNVVFLCAGLGGETGTGATQVLSDEIKRTTGALVVVAVLGIWPCVHRKPHRHPGSGRHFFAGALAVESKSHAIARVLSMRLCERLQPCSLSLSGR